MNVSMYKILIFSFIFLTLDQLSKWFVVFYLELKQKLYLNLNNQFINFYMAWNKGINFGLFEGDSVLQAYILTTVAVLISIVFFIWLKNSTSFFFAIISVVSYRRCFGQCNWSNNVRCGCWFHKCYVLWAEKSVFFQFSRYIHIFGTVRDTNF